MKSRHLFFASRPNFTILKLTFFFLQIYPSRGIRYTFPEQKEVGIG